MERFTDIERCESLEVLNYQIRACKMCRLSETRQHALVGEGNINAKIMFVALSPGTKENIQNRMFIGPSGGVFDKLIQTASINRKMIFMTNLVKCMLPKNRKPNWDEIEACNTYLKEEIAIVQPNVIVPLGYYATRTVLSKFTNDSSIQNLGFKSINGKLLKLDSIQVYPLTHPSALLYNPSFENETMQKYQQLKSFI